MSFHIVITFKVSKDSREIISCEYMYHALTNDRKVTKQLIRVCLIISHEEDVSV